MNRVIEGWDHRQGLLLPDCIDDYAGEDSGSGGRPVRRRAGPGGARLPGEEATGRPIYDPATLLELYVYGYLNQVRSSRGWSTRLAAT